ncbi:NACHT domain-containing protein [Streptosporangium sp. NPDC051023]|uniref:NACHT domain-containing protein n=1 Tax=Streptosporangium sp. NPDC051023 TaxID=3155410 RepID=UPI00344C1D25
MRRIARIIAAASLTVGVGVAVNQVLSGGELNWYWLGASAAVAVAAEAFAARPPEAGQPRGPLSILPGAPSSQRRTYLRQLRRSVRDIETVGVATQSEFVLRLRQVYVEVSLVPRPPQDTASEPYVGVIQAVPGERRTLRSFLDDSDGQVFAVIGGPGSGKTTLVRSTALELCRWNGRRRSLPVVVYLRDHAAAILTDPARGLPDVAASAGWTAGRIPAAWFGRRLDRGRCLVMLDGLDEVADEADRASVVAWVRTQIQRFPRNDYVITSRPHGYLSTPLASTNVLQIHRFTGEQISLFLHNWYYGIECRATGTAGRKTRADAARKADDLLERLRLQPALYDLAANPLLLTMIANVHRYHDALPGSRAALYAEMCQVLLHRRQDSKGLHDKTGLRGPQKEHVARALAWTMMTARIRDIPARQAREAIAPVLAQVSRRVRPGDFLDEADKSGLLVQREEGVYAFAHFTLQEYLAAAHVGEQPALLGRLVADVDDPWWRETVLLWAAGANATPVIEACLTSGGVHALTLAFECEEEALKVDPGVRGALEKLLVSPGFGGDARARLISTVKATRSLRDVIWLSEGVALCVRPVSRTLYAMFARDERAAGRHTPAIDGDPGQGGDEPAAGMWAGDAARFVTWLNALFDDGTTYRLPTAAELADPAVGLITDLTSHTIWAHSAPLPQLHRPTGVRWPYSPDPRRLSQIMTVDRTRMIPYLRLALATSHSERVLAYGRVLATAGNSALSSRGHRERRVLELVLNLSLARALARVFALDLSQVTGRAPARVTPDSSRAADQTTVRARAADCAHLLNHTLGLNPALNLDRPFHPTLGDVLDRAFTRSLALNGKLTWAAEKPLGPRLGYALQRARDIPGHSADDLDAERVFAGTIERILDHALIQALDLARTHGLGDVRADATDFDLAGARVRVPGLDRELADAWIRAPATEHGHGGPDPDRVLDLAFDLAFVPGSAELRTLVPAFAGLLSAWRSSWKEEPPPGRRLADLESLMRRLLLEAPQRATPPDREPTAALDHDYDSLSRRSFRFEPVFFFDYKLPSRERARLLAHQAQDLVASVLSRNTPYDESLLACARIGLLGALALLRTPDGHNPSGMPQAHESCVALREAVYNLIALQERADGHLKPNEILLLVRS